MAVLGVALLTFSGTGIAQEAPRYVGSQTCKTCHSGAFESWRDSHHALAWSAPSEDTVKADFDNESFEHKGRTSRFYRENGRYFIETSDTGEGPMRFEVKGVAGTEPLQQFLIETKPGRLQSFDVAWDTVRGRWYHLYPEQDLPPNDAFHWSGPYKTWNARCAECHATGYRKNYDPVSRSYQSTQSETGVGCEACHGPGADHLAWAQRGAGHAASPFPGSDDKPDTDDKGLLLSFRDRRAEVEIQQCAGCHARREPLQDGNPLPGTPFHDAYRLLPLRAPLYHDDGQIRDEVYVYGSFLQSRMYAKGVRCSDCHDVHAARLKATGNALCTQCHSEAGNPRFPSLALKPYDDSSHHHHADGSEAGQCVSCHMIERTYMGVDGRRDHSFRVPRPDLSVETGAPNACNDCHADRSAQWAADAVTGWYPESVSRIGHFGATFHSARNNRAGSAQSLLKIALHDGFPAIVRASAIDLWRGLPDTAVSAADYLKLTGDNDALVRSAALSALAKAPPDAMGPALESALADPAKTVRIAAARQILGLEARSVPGGISASVRRASGEWQASIRAKLDFPETHLVLGGAAMTLRNPKAAIRAFQEASTLDPQLADAWVMQVRLHLATNDPAAAEMALQRGLKNIPDNPDLLAFKDLLSGK